MADSEVYVIGITDSIGTYTVCAVQDTTGNLVAIKCSQNSLTGAAALN